MSAALQIGNRLIHQVLDAFAVDRADGENFVEAELGKFVRAFSARSRVHLVDGDQNGLPLFRNFSADFAVQRHDAFLHIDDEDDGVCGFDRQIHLFQRGLDDDVVGFFAAQQADAAGVHERERLAAPLGLGGDAVARDAGLVMHNRNPLADDAVEQRGFADIWPSDNGDEIWHDGRIGNFTGYGNQNELQPLFKSSTQQSRPA